ncbi:MAG: NAD-dependent succinate-semialdehyde dehydrogenase [Myxococcales bacterium]
MPIASVNPATGETVRTFEAHSLNAIDEMLNRAQEAFLSWRQRPLAERTRIVARAGEVLTRRRDELGALMTLEMGKLRTAALAEVDKCATACRHYAETGPRYLADEPVETDAVRSLIRYQPLGPVLAVMPWNFPLWQVFRFAAPALVAGNVGLLKHASSVPQCALAIESVFKEAGAPAGVFQTLLIEASRVKNLLADGRVVAATLTGSEGAGRSLAEHAGKHLKKVVLELGGSDPFVVMPSASLEDAVSVAVTARVQNAGQSCIAAKRFIVHEKIAARFEEQFVAKMSALRVGDPTKEETQMGPLSSEQLLRDIDAQVKKSVEMGARLLTGGKRLPGKGAFYAPTVLAEPPRGSPARDEEIFGPVAMLFRVRTLDEAIALANETRFGLGSAAFTNDPAEQERLCNELDAGQVFINGMVKSDPRLPFGGVKSSGFGRELSAFGIREFTNVKTVWVGKTSAQATAASADQVE